ncbi:hypothetical protein LINPERPRIM_LOCUS6132 [Linum perenne]
MRKEIAQFLQAGQESIARIRVCFITSFLLSLVDCLIMWFSMLYW